MRFAVQQKILGSISSDTLFPPRNSDYDRARLLGGLSQELG